MHRSPRAALLAACCLWTSALAAQSENPLVVDVTTFATSPRIEALEPYVQDIVALNPGSYDMVSIADPLFIETLRWSLPNGNQTGCDSSPPSVNDALSQAHTLWNQMDFGGALTQLSRLRKSLDCQNQIIDAEALKDLLFLEAAVHFYLEDGLDGSTFADYATMFPGAGPMPGYAPEIISAFRSNSAGIERAAPIILDLPPSLAAFNPILDGQLTADSSTVSLKPGQHFIQITGPNGEIRGSTFTVFAGADDNLKDAADVMPLRTPVVSATLRAQISSGRLDDGMIAGLSRYAETNDYPYLLFVVPDPSAVSQMTLRSLSDSGDFIHGAPSDYQARAPKPNRQSSYDDEDDGVMITGPSVKPPRRRGSSTSSRRVGRVSPTDTRIGLGLGMVYYDDVAFGSIQPYFDTALGPVALQLAGIYGIGPDALHLPGARAALLKRFYAGPFAPHIGLAYEVLAARVVTGGGAETLLIEGTPEVIGGTEFAFNKSDLRLTSQVGVGFTPGLMVLGGQGFEDGGRLSITFALGIAKTW